MEAETVQQPTTNPPATLANIVKNARVKQGLTQMGFAETWGISVFLITAIETLRRRVISGPELDRIAVACGWAPEQLWAMLGLNRVRDGKSRYVSLKP